jgi:hypothetical protein
MTGLTPDLQRVWRRRDQLPAYEPGTTDFSVLQVAEILVRYNLSVAGLSPSASGKPGSAAAPYVLWFALATVDGACEVVGEAGDVDTYVNRLRDGGHELDALAGVSEEGVYRYLVRTNRGDIEFHHDAGGLVAGGGFVWTLIVDLAAAGEAMALATRGRPLVTVTLATVGKLVRRLSRARALI